MHCLIVTSITHLQQYLRSSPPNMFIIVIGDHQDTSLLFKEKNIFFLNSQARSQLSFRSTNLKNIAYLLAIQHGARYIYEFTSNVSFEQYQNIQHIAFRRQRSPFINIHPTFTGNFTQFSPGLPTDEQRTVTEDGWSSIRTVDSYLETIRPLIQQQIPIYYQNKSLVVNHPPVAIESLTFTPFLDEDILFTYDAFWGIISFESKSTIWRSWWVQRLLSDINGHVVFASLALLQNLTIPVNTTHQIVNEDAKVGELVRFLSTWKSVKTTFVERIKQLFRDLVERKFCDSKELKAIQYWIDDLKEIKYVFPPIKTITPSSSPQVIYFYND